MEFSYHSYWVQLLLVPAVVLIIPIFMFCMNFYDYWIRKNANQRRDILNISKHIFFLLIILGIGIPNLQNIINSGIYLLRENETHQMVLCGNIETIVEPSKHIPVYKDAGAGGSSVMIDGQRYSEGAYGADITIDGQLYFAATSGDFQIGDRVVISYLPKSHIIMSMYAAPEEEAEENPNNNEAN